MPQIYTEVAEVALPVPFADTLTYSVSGVIKPSIGSRVWVELGHKKRVGIVIKRVAKFSSENELKPVLLDLDEGHLPTISKELLNELTWAASYYHVPLGEFIQLGIPQFLRKKYHMNATVEYGLQIKHNNLSTINLTDKQEEIVNLLKAGPIKEVTLSKVHNIPKQRLNSLIQKEIIERTSNLPTPEVKINKARNFSPNKDQRRTISLIAKRLNEFCPHIIHGVTGSGKTEIYLSLMEKLIDQKKQVLLIVPEIALTPQLEDRLRQRFGNAVGVIHSNIPAKTKMEIWKEARNGNIFCIVGTRSAAFLQFQNLGMIIIDEEHDQSLNQSSNQSYSARDFLTYRARSKNIPILLGSATPSLETFHNIEHKKYAYYFIGDRANNASLPRIKLIDLNLAKQKNGITIDMAHSIKAHLDQNKQALIFINRKGYAPVLYCNQCNDAEKCDHCSSNMVVYEKGQYIKCQLCNQKKPIHRECSKCGSKRASIGVGTQRVKYQLEQLFPEKRIAIIDNDFINTKDKLTNVIHKINNHEIDILVGTQILSKGHDFPNITLVGIIDGDHGLYGIDFRSQEKMAQLLFQVSGRAGRGQDPGEVIIQTNNLSHPVYSYLKKHDYSNLLIYLLQQRKETQWPPYTHLIALRANAKDDKILITQLTAIKTLIEKNKLNIKVLGPVFDIIKKRKKMYSGHLIIKQKNRKILHDTIHEIKSILKGKHLTKGITVKFDVDPYEL